MRPIKIAIPLTACSMGELQAAVLATFIVDLAQLKALESETGQRFDLYRSGIRYRREQRQSSFPDVERFQTLRSMLITRFGDCDDLAPLWAAQLVHDRVDLDARPCVIESPGIGFHVVTVRGDGSVNDPSARLGMLG